MVVYSKFQKSKQIRNNSHFTCLINQTGHVTQLLIRLHWVAESDLCFYMTS